MSEQIINSTIAEDLIDISDKLIDILQNRPLKTGEREKLTECFHEINNMTTNVISQNISNIIKENASGMENIAKNITAAKDTLKNIENIEQILATVEKVVSLLIAIKTGNVAGIVTAGINLKNNLG